MRDRAILPAAAMLALAVVSAGTAQLAMARLAPVPAARMDALDAMPRQLGEWTLVPSTEPTVNPALPDAFGKPVQLYDKVRAETYRRADGAQVTLMLAYMREQHQEERVHLPEVCYYAQGYVVKDMAEEKVQTPRGAVPARTFTANGADRQEQVLYWIRTGNRVSNEALPARTEIFTQGLRGRLVDGLLVRASIVTHPEAPVSAAMQTETLGRFLSSLTTVASPKVRATLIGQGTI